jgi:hypothetical protein
VKLRDPKVVPDFLPRPENLLARAAPAVRVDALLIALAVYCAASLLHYAHNAAFVDAYPNMPAWLSSAKIHGAWMGVTAVGLAGYLLVWRGYQIVGFAVIVIYAVIGFDGLAHYGLAPVSAHSAMMNFTIWLEVATAALLLAVVATRMTKRLRKT